MRWHVICDRCGAKRWNDELRREWQGLMVCRVGCWEARNAQERVRGVPDRQAPPWVRPEPTDVFLATTLMIYEDGSSMLIEQSDPLDLALPAMGLEDATP